MHVRPEQQAVVDPVLTALRHRANVGRLEDRRNARASNSALPVVGIEDYSLEGLLAQPIRREPWIAKDRPGAVPGLRQVEFYRHAEEKVNEFAEVRRD